MRPHVVVKGGVIAWAAMGDANASIPTPQPVLPRPMFGALGRTAGAHVDRASSSPAAVDDGLADRLGLSHRWCRSRTAAARKADMVNNDALPDITVDPDTFMVTVDGDTIEQDPASELPMAQRYFLF